MPSVKRHDTVKPRLSDDVCSNYFCRSIKVVVLSNNPTILLITRTCRIKKQTPCLKPFITELHFNHSFESVIQLLLLIKVRMQRSLFLLCRCDAHSLNFLMDHLNESYFVLIKSIFLIKKSGKNMYGTKRFWNRHCFI